MKLGTLCHRLRIDDASLKEVELRDYDTQKIEKVLKTLRSNLAVEKLVLRHCELTVESSTTLLLHFCKRPHGLRFPTFLSRNSWSKLFTENSQVAINRNNRYK